ncbi:MAG: ArsR family transcriptional regulator [Planctomycetota bacterium]|nr:MAG: ArsR family transcriptional regulator [Planctomycetota bacterium]
MDATGNSGRERGGFEISARISLNPGGYRARVYSTPEQAPDLASRPELAPSPPASHPLPPMPIEIRPDGEGLWQVTFRFPADAAGGDPVHLAGTFNDWDPTATAMALDPAGEAWEATLELPEGEHLYKFVLDEETWEPDPDNPSTLEDAFLGTNSVLELGRIAGRLPSLTLATEEQWRAVTSPRRLEILEFLLSAAPCTVAELATVMDTAADGLYHHLRILRGAGLVREVGRTEVGGRSVPVFDVVARELDFLDSVDPERLVALWRCLGRRATRLLAAAFPDGRRRLSLRSDFGWLDAEGVEKVRKHLLHIHRIFAEGRQSRRGRLYSLTHLLAPIRRSRRS